MANQPTQNDVSTLITNSLRPFSDQESVGPRKYSRSGDAPGQAPRSRPRFEKLRSKLNAETVLNVICVLLALGFLGLAASNVTLAGNFISIDSLFLTAVSLMLAGVFLVSPALTLWEKGLLKNPFTLKGDDAVVETEDVHFAGSTKLFLSVLGWLLVLTLIEVFLAYVHVPLHLMLTILIGLSLVKAALIMAYFMHLRFERMSLVLTLVPILVICICLLFIMFPDSFRSASLRSTPVSSQTQTQEGQH